MSSKKKKASLISLCMIVKDEAASLPRCLQSVQDVVDQIVVVDTGSTDDTVAIAKRFGATVVRAQWTNDFAAARNRGLAFASGEWILFLDADEELDAGTGVQLRQLAQQREITGYFLNIWNYMGESGSEGATINPVLRMFRNDKRYRFEGRIHEQIAGPITHHTPTARFHLSDAIIHHYGYKREIVLAKNKLERNRELLERAVLEEPDNRFHWYNLGVEYFRGRAVEDALRAFRQARDGIDYAAVSYAHLLVKHEVQCLQAMRRWQESLALTEEGLTWYADYPDLWHAKGVCLAALGQRRKAAEAFAAAIHIGRAPAIFHTEDGMGSYQSAYWLGSMHEAELDYETAAHWYAEAVRFRGSLLAPLYRLCHMMRICGSEEQLAQFVEDRFIVDSPAAAVKLADVMRRSGCYIALRLWISRRLAGGSAEEHALLLPWMELAENCAALIGGRRDLTAAEGSLGQAAEWLGSPEQSLFPEVAVEWLPLFIRSGTGGSRVKDVVGALLDGRPDGESSGIGSSNAAAIGVRYAARALCALADGRLAEVQQVGGFTQAAQEMRLLLPAQGEGDR
ncbi:glycosyltransferase family 2 protein [Paenibacillus albus]|nr:glycosyltransferase family 2 protein [Paenibacillus albus]